MNNSIHLSLWFYNYGLRFQIYTNKEMNILSKLNLLPNQKLCLTIEEAAIYSMLGENRLRKIIEENRTLDWVLYVGSWIRVKRPQFEEWIMQQNYL